MKKLFIIRTIESLYEELVQEGVIKKYPKVHLSDYIGDFRYILYINNIALTQVMCSPYEC